jgi:hypothetical protein
VLTPADLSAPAVAAACELSGVSLPPLFAVPDVDDPGDVRDIGRAQLAEAGLAGPGGLQPGLIEALRLVAAPQRALHVIIHQPAAGTTGLAAVLGDRAVLAEQSTADGGRIRLRPIEARDVVDALVGLLPPVAPGDGAPVQLPTEMVVTAADGAADGDELRSALLTAGARRADARFVADVLAGQRRLAAQFGGVVAEAGAWRQVGLLVDVIDVERGRYLVQHRPGDDGRRFTLEPADTALIARRVDEILALSGG